MRHNCGVSDMDREMTVGALVRLLRDEIAERETLLVGLEMRLGRDPPPDAPPREKGPSIASAVVAVLREVGRPMHGLDEIIPALAARGIHVKNKAGFATLLLRTRQIVRTSPGTFGLASDASPT